MPRRRFGQVLIGVGLATILVSVLWVLEAANGPGTGPKTFAERRGYDRVKESVHQTFPTAFGIGLLGLGAIVLGARFTKSRAA